MPVSTAFEISSFTVIENVFTLTVRVLTQKAEFFIRCFVYFILFLFYRYTVYFLLGTQNGTQVEYYRL